MHISSSVSASPMHWNLNSFSDSANFLFAVDKSVKDVTRCVKSARGENNTRWQNHKSWNRETQNMLCTLETLWCLGFSRHKTDKVSESLVREYEKETVQKKMSKKESQEEREWAQKTLKINSVCHGMRIWLVRSAYKSKTGPLVLDCHNYGKILLQNSKQMKNLHANEPS